MVSLANLRAFSQPSETIFLTIVGSSAYSAARACMGFSSLITPSITGCLHSMQPIPADLQPCCTHCLTDSSE